MFYLTLYIREIEKHCRALFDVDVYITSLAGTACEKPFRGMISANCNQDFSPFIFDKIQ